MTAPRDPETRPPSTRPLQRLRARYEIARAVGDKVTIVPDAVRSEPNFATLFREYHKYLAGLAGGLLGL